MQLLQLHSAIEYYRSEMISEARKTSFSDQKVIELSQKLDKLLNEYSEANKKKHSSEAASILSLV